MCVYLTIETEKLDPMLANVGGQEQKSTKIHASNNSVIVSHPDMDLSQTCSKTHDLFLLSSLLLPESQFVFPWLVSETLCH